MARARDIDSATRFKELLLELHRGADAFKLFEEFHDVIHSATPEDSVEIQEQLMIEGIPQKHAQQWSRSHICHSGVTTKTLYK